MQKILIGICGIGNGHINRQRLIINHLLEYDVEIVLAITTKSKELFDDLYPNIKKVLIYVPWIFCDNSGIDFEATRIKYIEDGIDQFNSFLTFSKEVQKAFNGENPDFIMTDYEPNSAQFAYATNKPLICFDQHSKFLNLSSEIISGFSINIEISRLLYFFPRAEKRYVTSFFKIKDSKKYNIEALPPILKNIQRGNIRNNKVIVYFSPYTSNPSKYIKILELIKNYSNYEFNIYTELEFSDYCNLPNLVFKKIGDEFDKDLTDCNFIISSAGHQLISEAINLEIPLYIFPLDTFEQNYFCYIIEKKKLGKEIKTCDLDEFNKFIRNIEKYRNSMKKHKKMYWKNKWNVVLFSKLENDFHIKKKEAE